MMGAGIAAQVANAGVPVVLLDIVPKGAARPQRDRRGRCREAAEDRAGRRSCSNAAAKLVTTGNIEDDLGLLADCDWIVEAVIERPDIKQRALQQDRRGAQAGLRRLVQHLDDPAPTLLTEGMPERFARDFLITHFFNPPRYMRLLEIVAGPRRGPRPSTRVARLLRLAARQGRRRLQGHARLHRQPPRHLLDAGARSTRRSTSASTVEEADAIIGQPDGHSRRPASSG